MKKLKIVRATTIPMSLDIFCRDILKELSHDYDVVAISSPGPEVEAIRKREGVRLIEVPMQRRVSLWKDLRSLIAIIKVLRKERPDMVHSMTPKAGLLFMIAARITGVPCRIHTFTGLVWPIANGLSRKILMTTDKITCACATHIIPEGQSVLEDLSNYGITKKPMKVLGYGNVKGIDLQYWHVNSFDKGERRKEKGDTNVSEVLEDTFTFLFVGRIVGDKGINELVKAFTNLVKRRKEKGEGRNCRLILVGGYEEKLDPILPETRRMIEETPEIEAVGPKFGDELKAYYAASDCFVFPSYREGFPNTVLEAGAMELPSIVTDINGSRDIVTGVSERVKELKSERVQGGKSERVKEVKSERVQGGESERVKELKSERVQGSQHLLPGETLSIRENGVMIPSKDADALYEAMLWMMDHEEERNQIGKRAREIVSERFEQGFVRKQLYDFYKEVLG